MNNKIFRIIMLFVTICVTAISTMLALSFGVSNITLKTNNDELGEENDNLTEENDNLNQEVGELNKVVDKLQDTIDNLDEHAAIATYLVGGEVWRIQIVQKNKEFELPVVDETDTQVYNGWKVNGIGDAVQTTSISEHTEFELDMIDKDWVKVNWFGLNNFNASNIWTDGTDYYYSEGNMHFKKDPINNAWEQVTWNGLTEFEGKYVWNYNGETYYSDNNIPTATPTYKQYVLDVANKTWLPKTWGEGDFKGPTKGRYVYFLDGEVYASGQYGEPGGGDAKLTGNAWVDADYNINQIQHGYDVWTDGVKVYANSAAMVASSNGGVLVLTSCVWDSITKKWNETAFAKKGVSCVIQGRYVWTDGTATYYSTGTETSIIDTVNHTLNEKTWIGGPSSLDGQNIWTDGENIYYSNGTEQYVFVK